MAKYHRLNSLSNRYLFLTVLEPGKSKIKVPTNSTPGEESFPGLQRAAFSFCPMWQRQRNRETERDRKRRKERERECANSALSFLLRALIPLWGPHLQWPHLITTQALFPNIISSHRVLGLQHMSLLGGHNSVHSSSYNDINTWLLIFFKMVINLERENGSSGKETKSPSIKRWRFCSGWCAQWIEWQPGNWRVTDSILSERTCLGCGLCPHLGTCGRTNWYFSSSLSSSLPLLLKISEKKIF